MSKTSTVTIYNHVVVLTEYERGWGSKEFVAKAFDTKEAAEAYINEVNSENTAPRAPDYYIQARYEENMPQSTFEAINRN